MKVLVIGGAGMLGHRVFKHFRKNHETAVTLKSPLEQYQQFGLFNPGNAFENIDVRDFKQVQAAITAYRPEAVINCVGITNKGKAGLDPILNIEVNSLFPQRLSKFCADQQIKLIHISTDCVFSGRKGGYRESDSPDATDLYGRTKLLGEVDNPYSLTIRTSLIGLGLEKNNDLVEWFLGQKGYIRGYRNAIFSGFTTHELSRILELILVSGKKVASPMHVSGNPISKYDLLTMVKEHLGMQIDILPDMNFKCDRSLDSKLFQNEFGYTPAPWAAMIEELCEHIKSERL